MNAFHEEAIRLPLNLLRKGDRNPRREGDPDYASMAQSLKAVGQLQNIVVCSLDDGSYKVMAGDRRYEGFKILASDGSVQADHPVLCLVRAESDYEAISAIENITRKAMHPADECDAARKMQSAGMTIDRIADALGVTPTVVERRLSLAKAAPSLLAIHRSGDMSTEQLAALCATDVHELQISTWENAQDWERNPKALRRLVLSAEIDLARDPRAKFIGGASAFATAGGAVRRDIFSDVQNGGFTNDEALLNRLVTDQLNARAAEIQNEGWAWVDVRAKKDEDAFNRCGKVGASNVSLSPQAEADIEKLVAERNALQDEKDVLDGKEYSDDDQERISEIWDRLEAIEEAIKGLKDSSSVYPADIKAYAGVMIWLDTTGTVQVVRGLVRTEDRAKAAKVTREISGGRETQPAGRKDGEISDALRRSLLGYRNAAAQVVLAGNARVAKVLLACQIASFDMMDSSLVPSDLVLSGYSQGTRLHHEMQGNDADAYNKRLQDVRKKVVGLGSKATAKALWEAMNAKSDAELDAIVAYGVAASLSLYAEHTGMTALLLEALDFDMSEQFTPTADSYFGRVSKEFMVEALVTSGKRKANESESLLAMKKGDLAALAASETKGTGWVPALIRSPKPKAAKPAAPKAPTKSKTPAKTRGGAKAKK